MQINIVDYPYAVVLFVQEARLDAHNSQELKTAILQEFDADKKNLIVDLGEVRFIDSSGLGVLVSGFKNASARNGVLLLSTMQSQVKSMFELTRLHRVFDIFATSDEALASLNQTNP